MIDVGAKPVTRRRAVARGTAELSPAAFAALRDGRNPKGQVLALAEAAGIAAAKKTSDLIPLCHPLPLSRVGVRFELDPTKNAVTVFCEAIAEAKTGVEMEALSGVNGALLTIYDLSKAIDPVITLSGIRLDLKEGGKSGHWENPAHERKEPVAAQSGLLAGVRAAVLTVSDRVSRREADDLSGPRARALLEQQGAGVVHTGVIADEKDAIAAAIRWAAREASLVVLTGGTGLGPRDVTPEAVAASCERLVPGLGELLRQEGARHTPMSWLSRSVAGICTGPSHGPTLVVALPGSVRAVEQGLATLSPLLPHALQIAAGGRHGA